MLVRRADLRGTMAESSSLWRKRRMWTWCGHAPLAGLKVFILRSVNFLCELRPVNEASQCNSPILLVTDRHNTVSLRQQLCRNCCDQHPGRRNSAQYIFRALQARNTALIEHESPSGSCTAVRLKHKLGDFKTEVQTNTTRTLNGYTEESRVCVPICDRETVVITKVVIPPSTLFQR